MPFKLSSHGGIQLLFLNLKLLPIIAFHVVTKKKRKNREAAVLRSREDSSIRKVIKNRRLNLRGPISPPIHLHPVRSPPFHLLFDAVSPPPLQSQAADLGFLRKRFQHPYLFWGTCKMRFVEGL